MPADANAPDPQTTPLDMVVLVDESGSLTPDDVREEIKSTSTIAQSGLNTKTRVTVIGFGSNNGEPGQQAATERCRPTIVSSAVELQYLSDCVKKLHQRTDAEGNDTDHVQALSQALDTLSNGSPEGAIKVVFLLTDGRLDVSRSPQYGRVAVASDRNAEAEQQLVGQLNLAQTGNVQIWPLGFGDQVGQSSLDRFARGGSQQACDDRAGSKPRARIVRDPQEVLRSLYEVYAASSCSGLSPTDSTTLESGQQKQLKILIPPIATDGKIAVSKGDPNVRVEYVDPAGKPVTASGKAGDSVFTRAGENGTVETLGIVNPVAGTWTVKLTAPPRLSKRLVSATALWQGAVRSSIIVEPPSARTGQQVNVRLSLLTRKGALTDTKALNGMEFKVGVTGQNLPAPQNLVVHDDGKAPDDTAKDGRYAGTFKVPDTAGTLTFTGLVSGEGLRAERIPVSVVVSAEGPVLQGKVDFDPGKAVHPGDTVTGRVTMHNGGTAPVRARLVLEAPDQVRASLSPTSGFDLPPGRTVKDLTVAIGRDAALGGTSMTVSVTAEADPTQVLANGLITTTIQNPPGWAERNRWEIIGAFALLVLVTAVLLFRRRARRRRVDVRGLFASLRTSDGESASEELKSPGTWAEEFRFTIRDIESRSPQLDYPRPGEPIYRARHSREGKITVRVPGGEQYEIALGGTGEPLPEGHLLVFRDTRRARSRPTPRRRPAPRSQPTPSAQEQPTPSPAAASQGEYDPWL
ncbi:MAG: VWA domain-containing protein [Streptosporangiaceae bacterium]